MLQLKKEGVYIALQRPFPTIPNNPEDILDIDAGIDTSVHVVDTIMSLRSYVPRPNAVISSIVKRAMETTFALWNDVEEKIFDRRLGFGPDPEAWRTTFAGVPLGTPQEQYEHARELVRKSGEAASEAILEEAKKLGGAGKVLWVVTHSPIVDFLAASFHGEVTGKGGLQWLYKQLGPGAVALFHLDNERYASSLRFFDPNRS